MHSYINLMTSLGLFSSSDLKSLVEESLVMVHLNHPNVMKLIGVCIDQQDTPYIVMPYMSLGSLLSYLRKNKEELMINSNEGNYERVKVLFVFLCQITLNHIRYRMFSKDYSQCVYKLLKEWSILQVKSLFTEILLPGTACELAKHGWCMVSWHFSDSQPLISCMQD